MLVLLIGWAIWFNSVVGGLCLAVSVFCVGLYLLVTLIICCDCFADWFVFTLWI